MQGGRVFSVYDRRLAKGENSVGIYSGLNLIIRNADV